MDLDKTVLIFHRVSDDRFMVACVEHRWSRSYVVEDNAKAAWYGHLYFDHGMRKGRRVRYVTLESAARIFALIPLGMAAYGALLMIAERRGWRFPR